jgi:predicted ArsR family transcriptional regulator
MEGRLAIRTRQALTLPARDDRGTVSDIADRQTEEHVQRLVAGLGDPTRRRIFFQVRTKAPESVTKDDIAAVEGIDRRMAGFHLDKLVDQGFLDADFRRRSGRSGPGAGRPAKFYRLAEAEFAVALGERHYELLAGLLLKVAADTSGDPAEDVLERVGYAFGLEVGRAEVAAGRRQIGKAGVDAVAEVARLLSRYGFAAQTEGNHGLKACACPFEELAFGDPERVCGLDRAIWKGMFAAFDADVTITASGSRALGDEACEALVESVATGLSG